MSQSSTYKQACNVFEWPNWPNLIAFLFLHFKHMLFWWSFSWPKETLLPSYIFKDRRIFWLTEKAATVGQVHTLESPLWLLCRCLSVFMGRYVWRMPWSSGWGCFGFFFNVLLFFFLFAAAYVALSRPWIDLNITTHTLNHETFNKLQSPLTDSFVFSDLLHAKDFLWQSNSGVRPSVVCCCYSNIVEIF